jgi:hypothetical protein
VPDPDGPGPKQDHHRFMLARADQEVESGRKWGALSKTLSSRP